MGHPRFNALSPINENNPALASLTSKQYSPTPTLPAHHFSNILGFFPAIIHRFTPKLNLTLGQLIASQLKTGPKAITSVNLPLISTASNIQQGMVKTYLSIFFLTLIIILLLILP
ncbi:hypothetical protein INR49_022844 [Caranx melampygus]|nr:hypothetical protein INR49_022844 [Caranx melampygus]